MKRFTKRCWRISSSSSKKERGQTIVFGCWKEVFAAQKNGRMAPKEKALTCFMVEQVLRRRKRRSPRERPPSKKELRAARGFTLDDRTSGGRELWPNAGSTRRHH